MKNKLYTDKEERYLNRLIDLYENEEISITALDKKSSLLMKRCSERKNRIRYNEITPLDKKRGFTPENFPYLTVFSQEYYPKREWDKLQDLNKKKNQKSSM